MHAVADRRRDLLNAHVEQFVLRDLESLEAVGPHQVCEMLGAAGADSVVADRERSDGRVGPAAAASALPHEQHFQCLHALGAYPVVVQVELADVLIVF